MERKRLISIILTLSMIISIIPFMPSTAMADGTVNLNAEGTVKATLTTNSDGTDTIKISGEGKIDRDKWIDMVVSFKKGESLYDEDKKMDYPYWDSLETKKTTLKVENNKIKLPDNSLRLFQIFKGNIELPEDLDTSNITDMSYMFSYTTTVDLKLRNWDTSNVTDMSYMFEIAQASELDVSNWNTSNVRNMRGMFYGIEANPDVSKWDTSSVTNMSSMFSQTEVADPDVSNWDTSSVTDMSFMFNHAEVADPDVSNWNTSSVIDMSCMFRFAYEANPDVSNWDVSNVENMNELFSVTKKANPDVSNWDVSSVVNMHSMFWGAKGLKGLDISNWNTSLLQGRFFGYKADLGLKTLELDYFIMKRKPGADNPDANKAKENIEGFKAPKFSGDYIVKTFNDKGEVVKTESKKQNEEYNFDDNTHYEVRVNGINKLSFDENYDGGKVINKYFRPPFILSELPKAKERDGYKFVEWNTKADGTGEKVEAGGTYTEDTVIYAKWKKTVKPPIPDPDPSPTPDPDPNPTPSIEKEIDKLYIKGYKDGNFKPGENMTRGEVATVFSRLLEDKLDFDKVDTIYPDVKSNHWASGAVKYLSDKGIVKGNPDGNFYPDNKITRAEYATIIANMKQLTAKNSDYFTDIDNHWGKDNINAAAEAGIVNGYGNKIFKPENAILRSEAVAMTNRAFNRVGDRKFIDANLKAEGKFPDVDIAHWAYTDIYEAATTHEFERNNDGSEKWIKIMELGRVLGMQ